MPWKRILDWFRNLFGGRKTFSLGLYGNVNAGKSTLANRISKDWTGEEMSAVSEIPHETRTVIKKERVRIKAGGRELTMNILDMPGIATKVDYRDFVPYGLSVSAAQQRAKEATKGVIEAIKWLEHVDVALVIMDACEDPYTQVNLTILGNLEARNIPVVIVANKIDKKSAKPDKVRTAFPQHEVVEISALKGDNVHKLYEVLGRKAR